MEVNLVIAARDINANEVTNDLDIFGVVTEALPKALPGLLPLLYLIVFCEADATEVGQVKLIEISLVHSDGELRRKWYDSYEVPRPRRPGERSLFSPIFRLQDVPFADAGNYAFAVNVNGDYKNRLPFYVHEPTETNPFEEGESNA